MRFLEFTIGGPPVSHQSRNRSKLTAWKLAVRDAAAAAWGNRKPTKERLQVTVAYYHEGTAIRMDNDNLVKPIQDAMNQLVYEDDRQVTDVVVRKTGIDWPIVARGASPVVLEAFARGKEFLHVTVSTAPDHVQPLRGKR